MEIVWIGDREAATEELTKQAVNDIAWLADLLLDAQPIRHPFAAVCGVTVKEDENGDPLNVGRKRRVVSPRLKRALLSRDKTCTYPACTHDKWLEAHHVMHSWMKITCANRRRYSPSSPSSTA